MQAEIHTKTHILYSHIQTHTQTLTHIHANMQTNTNLNTNTNIHTQTNTFGNASVNFDKDQILSKVDDIYV